MLMLKNTGFIEEIIDDYIDICQLDKRFFKLWNKFLYEKEFRKPDCKRMIIEFMKEEAEELKYLKECLHLITIYDQQKLDLPELTELFEFSEENF